MDGLIGKWARGIMEFVFRSNKCKVMVEEPHSSETSSNGCVVTLTEDFYFSGLSFGNFP